MPVLKSLETYRMHLVYELFYCISRWDRWLLLLVPDHAPDIRSARAGVIGEKRARAHTLVIHRQTFSLYHVPPVWRGTPDSQAGIKTMLILR